MPNITPSNRRNFSRAAQIRAARETRAYLENLPAALLIDVSIARRRLRALTSRQRSYVLYAEGTNELVVLARGAAKWCFDGAFWPHKYAKCDIVIRDEATDHLVGGLFGTEVAQ